MKRVLTVQDLSCAGRCSLTEALPVLSLCGVETVALPTAVLSTHTGGFGPVILRDLTEELPRIAGHWQAQGIAFDGMLTGYLSSPRQAEAVRDILMTLGKSGCVRIADPVMGDNGKLYSGFEPAFVGEMKKLCAAADVLVPNLTEACLLTGLPWREQPDRSFAEELLGRLTELGPRRIVLTGVPFPDGSIGVMTADSGKIAEYAHEKLSRSFHGTGDLYAAVLTGALLRGRTLEDAARIGADFVLRCLKHTPEDADPRFGTYFETVLPELPAMLEA